MTSLEQCSKILYAAVAQYHKQMKNLAGGDLASQAVTIFWEQLEPRAQNLIDLAADFQEDKVKSEHRIWFQIMDGIYNDSCPHETARQLTAWVEANPKFNRKKGKSKNGK